MAGKLRSIIIAPMGGGDHKEPDGDEEMNHKEPDGDESEDGLRETYDEMKQAMDKGDDDAAFEALRAFVQQVCAKEEY